MSHVAFLIPTLDRLGGAERQVLALAPGLAARNWRVSVVALSGSGNTVSLQLNSAGVRFFSLHMRHGLADPSGWLRFHRWLRVERPDVLHTHLPHATWIGRWSRPAAPFRVLVDTVHSAATGTVGRQRGYRWSAAFSDRVTAVGRAAAQSHIEARMVASARVAVLPNGVALDRFQASSEARAAVRSSLGIGREFLWFAAGRLEPVKDYPTLLRAFAELPGEPHLVIAGAGPQDAALRGLAGELGLSGRVRLPGFQANVLPLYQAADAYVLSSLWEGLPVALMEAGACELPAVATDVPGVREVLAPGVTGYVCAPASVPALRDAMMRLTELPPDARAAMGQRARRHIDRAFSLSSVLDRWETLYRELLAQNPKPRRFRA